MKLALKVDGSKVEISIEHSTSKPPAKADLTKGQLAALIAALQGALNSQKFSIELEM